MNAEPGLFELRCGPEITRSSHALHRGPLNELMRSSESALRGSKFLSISNYQKLGHGDRDVRTKIGYGEIGLNPPPALPAFIEAVLPNPNVGNKNSPSTTKDVPQTSEKKIKAVCVLKPQRYS